MTKIVTATAVVGLAERGALELDDPVRRWVPAFPGGRGARVTVRHLLSHSAGLANPIPVGWVRPVDRPPEPDFTARMLARHSRLRAERAPARATPTLSYLVLGEVIAAAGGMPYTDYVRANVLIPLGMPSTDFAYRPEMERRAATGYHPRFGLSTALLRAMVPRVIFDHPVGHLWALSRFLVQGAAYGGLVGPVEDAARFLRLHLGAADQGCRLVLSREGVAAMQRPTARGRKLDVALGWFRRADPERGPRYWEHLGGGGFFNTMRVYAEPGVGLIGMGTARAGTTSGSPGPRSAAARRHAA